MNHKSIESSRSPSNVRLAERLTVPIILLAAVAGLGGLFLPGLYREPAELALQIQGQDLITLAAVAVLVVALFAARRGSARAQVVWVGMLGYLLYTYIGAAFAYAYNEFLLIYVALFSLCAFALVAAATGIDVAELRRRFDAATPRGPVIAFLLLMAFMLSALWLGQNIAFLVTGTPPAGIEAGGNFQYVYALDLGMIVPLSLLAVVWLRRRLAWGYVLAGFLLIKAATMGLALLSMTWFLMRAGLPADMGLAMVWILIAAGGLGLSVWFLRHCRG